MNVSRDLNILVVGINYAPEQTGIGPYTAAAAEYLAARGHQVTVYAGVPHYPSWTVPREYRQLLSRVEILSGVTVRRFRHFVPRRQDALRRGWYELTFAAQVLARCGRGRPDVVVTIVPSLLSAAVGARTAKRYGAQLVVWVQDLMSAGATQSGMQGGRYVAGLVRQTEQWILRQADAVVVATDAFRPFAEQYGAAADRLVTVPNWSRVMLSTKDRAKTRAERGWKSDQIIVLHTGNMGLKQDLYRVVKSARMVKDCGQSQVVFVLMGDGSQRKELEVQCRGVENVRLVDPVSESDYSDVLAAADILLINERVGLVDMSLPSKLTSYLASGRPVVGAVDWAGSTAAEILRSGGGVVTASQTPEGIVTAVLSLADEPHRAAGFGERGRLYARTHLSPEASLTSLADLVEARASASKARRALLDRTAGGLSSS